jgi:predicted polyphosphate/ATP-dependent NAD kinase
VPKVEPARIGLIINPIAGIGGPLATHGSDLFQSLDAAVERGGRPIAHDRAARALRRLRRIAGDETALLTASGSMGADVATECGFDPVVIADTASQTTAEDTMRVAEAMFAYNVDLLLFAGGDGTACDIFSAIGDRIPLIGIPTGVKMHSAVFAFTPEAAGDVAASAVIRQCDTRPAEVMDADQAELAAGRPSARLFGYAATPALPALMQPAKGARPAGGEAAIEALGRMLARDMAADRLVILGPGTTMQNIKQAFGFEGTLLGVDAVAQGKVIALDADAQRLENLCDEFPAASLFVSVIGNQGFVFGRGNQQITPQVIRMAGRANVYTIATREKLLAMPSPILHADTGDVDLDRDLAGYHRVLTGPNDVLVMRLAML